MEINRWKFKNIIEIISKLRIMKEKRECLGLCVQLDIELR